MLYVQYIRYGTLDVIHRPSFLHVTDTSRHNSHSSPGAGPADILHTRISSSPASQQKVRSEKNETFLISEVSWEVIQGRLVEDNRK